jgi:hypothetical protein
MHLIQLVLPLADNFGKPFAPRAFDNLQKELAAAFGGVTAYTRSPAVGLWKEGANQFGNDRVVVFEVLTNHLDNEWWSVFRGDLEIRFEQKEVFICAIPAKRL